VEFAIGSIEVGEVVMVGVDDANEVWIEEFDSVVEVVIIKLVIVVFGGEITDVTFGSLLKDSDSVVKVDDEVALEAAGWFGVTSIVVRT